MIRNSPRPTRADLSAALLTIAGALGVVCFVSAQQDPGKNPTTEYDLKAHFLCLVPGYVTAWPANLKVDGSKAIVIGVLGEDPFGDKLDKAAEARSKKGSPITVLRFATVGDFKPCHILFIGPQSGKNEGALQSLREWQQKTPRPWPILVSDSEELAREGIHVYVFLQADRRLAFTVNLEMVRQSEIRFDPNFLSLSKPLPR
jgi:hypothetical protein